MNEKQEMLTREQTALIFDKLNQRGVVNACPMCRRGTFTIVDGFLSPLLSKDLRDAASLQGIKHMFPSVGLVCTNCGFTSSHSLLHLDLMHLFQTN
jgi:hypothetical protein